MGEVRHPLIPQFSLRLILGIISALALAAFVVSTAGRGWAWAAGVSLGLLAIVVAFAVYALLFGVAWLFSRLIQPFQSKAQSSSTKKALLGLFVLCELLAAAPMTFAASGGSITLPLLGPNQTNKTGLELTIDTVWIDSFGYRPVRVEARSIAGPVAADRVLTIRFRPRMGYTQQNSAAVTQTLELPAGSSEAKATISAPQEGLWGSFEMDVFADGQYVEQLSIGANAAWTSWSGTDQGDRSLPVILMLSNVDRMPGVDIQIGGDSPEELVVRGDNKSAANAPPPGPGLPGSNSLRLNDLPTQWIDYSGVDMVICSEAELQAVVERFPAQWRGIHDWLRNGGNLVVYGAGKKWEKIAELEQSIGLIEQDAKVAREERDPAKRGWRLPVKKLRTNELIETAAESAQPDVVAVEEAPFMTRRYGLGMVAVIRSDEAFNGGDFRWSWLFNTLGPERWQWFQRWGVSLARENADFWNFLIPGVGLAPVTQFQVFITLFMLAIGPLNYFLLRRWGKLNLMVLTVPAGAVVVTIGLIATALLADGLGVRLRARSITNIDQRTGEATCWARLSYYAGLAPAGGLKFSDETVVLPLEAEPEGAAEKHSLRVVDWERMKPADPASALEQRLSEGWLPARTPTQFITARIGQTKARVEVKPAAADQGPQIVNHLGSRVEQLVLIDENGGCFVGDNLLPNTPATLRRAQSQHEAFGPIGALLTANQPELPPAMIYNFPGRSFFGLGGQYRNRYLYRFGPSYPTAQSGTAATPAASQSTGVLERSIREIAEQLKNDRLPPRSYVAVVETSPEMELGTPGAKEESSFHIVVGKW